MNILLLGSGGRENTLAWKLSQSKDCNSLFIAPGNAGSSNFGTNVNLDINDFETLKRFCLEQKIDILFPGSEEPLVNGIYDFFKNDVNLKHIIIPGPSKHGAQLEGSKSFSKKLMLKYGIPTASYAEFDEFNYEEGLVYIKNHSLPIVLKADGLAAGKGVVISNDIDEAQQVFTDMIKNAQFGEASKKVVIEQFLDGIELSVFAFTDGKNYILLPEAKDYKRINEGDNGLNTGGMGAVSPVPFADTAFMSKVVNKIVEPTISALLTENIDYKGFIFFGLIKVNDEPLVIEYNCRLGDPETEVIIPRLENDLVDLITKMDCQKLDEVTVNYNLNAAATVMLVSKGYPEAYEKGKVISGLSNVQNCIVFHAGTKMENDDILTSGGRVLAITSMGSNIKEALNNSYQQIEQIQFEGKSFRKDIGHEFV